MTKWWVIAFALVLFTAVGCNIVTSAVTSRSIGAAERDELDFSRLPDSRLFQINESRTGNPSDPSSRYREILTPLVVQDPVTQAGPIAAGPAGLGTDVEAPPAEQATSVVPPNSRSSQLGPTPRFPDITLTIRPTRTPTPAFLPTPQVEESTTRESPQAGSTATVGEELPTPGPRQACIRPGGMTLWLEPSGREWFVPVGQTIEVNLCLSNISADLAGFDVLLELERTGTAEFRELSMGGFGLESHSELPAESLRIRAIDLKKRLTAGADGVVLATMELVGVGVGESPMQIGLNGIDDTDGNSVNALVVDSLLSVTAR